LKWDFLPPILRAKRFVKGFVLWKFRTKNVEVASVQEKHATYQRRASAKPCRETPKKKNAGRPRSLANNLATFTAGKNGEQAEQGANSCLNFTFLKRGGKGNAHEPTV